MIIDEKVEHIVEKTLSISIAAYNVEEFLKNTLDSLVAPEIMDDIEVLIIDDGSKDNTQILLRLFQNQTVVMDLLLMRQLMLQPDNISKR